MDEIKTNVRGTFINRVGKKAIYFFVLTALVATAAFGYWLLPDSGTVSAQEETAKAADAKPAKQVVTAAMLNYALDLGTASEYTVYAEKGIAGETGSNIRGGVGDALRGEVGEKATKELSRSINGINQLPCTELTSTDLGGKSFGPGVYCLASADLAGEMTLDGAGDGAGIYVFKIAGALNTKSGSSISLENGAQASNVFFSADSAIIGENSSFRANIVAKGNIEVKSGSSVDGKTLSLGKVLLSDNNLGGATPLTGTVEICKEEEEDRVVPQVAGGEGGPAPATAFSNRIFAFTVTGVAAGALGSSTNPVRVPVGSCSAPFEVPNGLQTVTELNSGTLITPSNGTFTGNFELVNVRRITRGSIASPHTLGLVNLAARTAVITIVAPQLVPPAPTQTQLILEFTNRPALTGFIEICKRAASGPGAFNPAGGPFPDLSGGDPDVTGFFDFTIDGVFTTNTQNPNERVLQVFSVPVGGCSRPLSVTVGDPAPFGTPRRSRVFVTELGRDGFFLEDVTAIRGTILHGPVFGVGINANGNTFGNNGGGFVDVQIFEGADATNEVLLVFTNRSNPSIFKVCKIAGPGVPINTIFRFTVIGDFGALDSSQPQDADFGPVTQVVDVRAGDPARGGLCEIVPGLGAGRGPRTEFQTFLNGTRVRVFENGISPLNDISQAGTSGQLRTSRITSTTGFTSTGIAGFSPNPDLSPAAPVTQTFSSGDRNDLLANPLVVTVPVFVPTNGEVLDVNVRIRLHHTNDADLDISATNPSGVTRDLSSDNGGAGDNFGTGANSCAGTPTTFDDSAATSVTAGVAPFSGSFRPEQSLAAFNGLALLNGNYSVTVIDDDNNGEIGRLGCVEFVITFRPFVSRASVFARASITEVTFVNFRFNPTILKVCKDVLPGVTQTSFNFTVDLISPVSQPGNVPLFPTFSQNLTVLAGSCTPVIDSGLLGGGLNIGSTIRITEGPAGSTVVGSITADNGAPLSCTNGLCVNLGGRTATLIGSLGLVAGVNNVTFLNTPGGPGPTPTPTPGGGGDLPVRFDFDGDRKADPSIFTPSDAKWTYAASEASGANRSNTFGVSTDILVPADYDGDGKTDHAVFRPSNGQFYFLGTTGVYQYHQWGEAGDIPQAGDFDGDRKADFVVFRPSNGTWYMKNSTEGFRTFQFGVPSDKPYSADYDGDGKTDAGVFRNGTWFTLGSSQGFRVTQFGAAGDVPVPADYDGDRKADFAVYRNGTWFVLTATRYYTVQLGSAAEKAVPADYDGDGKTDIAVYRGGTWSIQNSGAGENAAASTVSLGSATDVPLPSL